jgi:hypothetical protein
MSSLPVEHQRALDALRRAVAEALDRKRRLGQYAVIWRDGKVLRIDGAELSLLASARGEKNA